MKTCLTLLTMMALLLLPTSETSAKQVQVELPHSGDGSLRLTVDDSWSQKVVHPNPPLLPALELTSPSADGTTLEVTSFGKSEGGPCLSGPEDIANLLRHLVRDQKLLEQAVETELVLHELRGPCLIASFFTLTDKDFALTDHEPEPGEFPLMIHGIGSCGEMILSFTILHRDPEAPSVREALEFVRSALYTPPRTLSSSYQLRVPGQPWALTVDLEGFLLDQDGFTDDGASKMMLASNDATGVTISIYLEPRPDLRSAGECRDFYQDRLARSPLKASRWKKYSRGEMEVVEHTIKKIFNAPVQQRNLNAYLWWSGYCADIHLSKVLFEPRDMALFDAVLDSVSFTDEPL